MENEALARVQKVATAVQDLFAELDAHIAQFQHTSGLSCVAGCGKCCFYPHIEATVLEFIPLAIHLLDTQSDEQLDAHLQEARPLCRWLSDTGAIGLCTQYAHRGLICRLFGYSARLNKHGQRELITCSILKEKATDHLSLEQTPMMTTYYQRLQNISPELSRDFYPIDQAIRLAIDYVVRRKGFIPT